MTKFKIILILVCFTLAGCYATTNLNNEGLNYVPSKEILSKGHDLYQTYCEKCHGADLTGNGPKAVSLDPKPANLRERSLHFTQTAIKGVLDYPHYSYETIEDKVKYGNNTMPPLKELLTHEEIDNLVHYISAEIRAGN